jgi:hypothetical protein
MKKMFWPAAAEAIDYGTVMHAYEECDKNTRMIHVLACRVPLSLSACAMTGAIAKAGRSGSPVLRIDVSDHMEHGCNAQAHGGYADLIW